MEEPSTKVRGESDGPGGSSLPSLDRPYWERPCESVAKRSGLTPREADVLEQLARGRDLPYMEDRLSLSRNTVKMHIKRVYAKLGVHGKQELIDLVDAEREEGWSGGPSSLR